VSEAEPPDTCGRDVNGERTIEASTWAAVVVNFNAGDALVACVDSLFADTSAGGPPEVVVVDNHSDDGSADALAAAYPDVMLVRAPMNLCFSRANNLGVAATHAAVVAAVNPDVEVDRGTAAALLDRLDAAPDLAAVGPRVRNPDGSQYPSARVVPSGGDALGHAILGPFWPSNPFTRRYRRLDADWSRPRDVGWLSGSALWFRRTAFDEVGGWDERFFMYLEDVDLCARLTAAGWRVAYEPAGAVLHLQGLSTARHPYRMIIEHHRSAARFAAKHWHGPRRLLLGPAVVLLAVRAATQFAARAVGGRTKRPRTIR
jgi:N-acetylglucosaminyl-diphospho-decaprenol L-rhamnosyltransferase